MNCTIHTRVNGRKYVEENVEPRMLLVHFLRDRLRLTGAHVGCDSTELWRLHGATGWKSR